MIQYIRTNSDDQDFKNLVRLLDEDLRVRDGLENDFYAQFNKIDKIKYVVLAYEEGWPVGCGAIKEYAPEKMEVKRMYVVPARRGAGIASGILKELEDWARQWKITHCLLETGKRQPEAIALYQKNGYRIIPNFGQYEGVDNSLCFEKKLSDPS